MFDEINAALVNMHECSATLVQFTPQCVTTPFRGFRTTWWSRLAKT